jgi:uncharacterized protein YndB with AHSA1/START domain
MAMESEDFRMIEVAARVAAPADDVFRAFTDADELAAWWGPEGFSVSEAQTDPRPGGAIRIGMVAPDGTVQPVEGAYRQVGPSVVAFQLSPIAPDGAPHLDGVVSVELITAGDETDVRVTAEGRAFTPQGRLMVAGMHEGWVESLRCLQRYLEERDNPSLKMRHDGI